MTHMPRPRPPRITHRSNGYFYYASRAIAALLVMGSMAAIGVLIVATLAQNPDTTTPAASVPQASGSTPPYAAYFVAADSDGIQQLWGLTLPDGQSRPLTHAPHSIFRYAISADHTQVAYVSDNQIWRQTFGQSDAEPLVYVSPLQIDFATLAFSPDGQSLAYHNNGLWILDLATGNAEELLTDVPIADDAPDVLGLRFYKPLRFLDNDRILVDVRMWETTTRGIYYLSSHTMQEVAGAYGMLTLMPLQDGRYLAYSPTFVGPGVDGFLLGQPSADPFEPFALTPILSEFFAAHQLFRAGIIDTIEVAPGQLRFIGTSFVEAEARFQMFMGTYDFNTNAFTIDTSPETLAMLEQAVSIQSPDGRYIAGSINATEVNNVRQATLIIVDLETRLPIELTVPSPVMYFEWANRK